MVREDCVKAEARGFVERVFGGEASPMLAWMLRESRLSAADLDELQGLLDAKRRRGKKR